MSPERLWLLSIALQQRGHRRLALAVKRLNAFLYHNSLPLGATVSPDVRFLHKGFGTIVHDRVVIGKRVRIYHHVTLAVQMWEGTRPATLYIEDDVMIGANSVVITPIGKDLRIGRAARIGAGVVVTHDVPAGASVVSAPARVLMDRAEGHMQRAERDAAATGEPQTNGTQDPHDPTATGEPQTNGTQDPHDPTATGEPQTNGTQDPHDPTATGEREPNGTPDVREGEILDAQTEP